MTTVRLHPFESQSFKVGITALVGFSKMGVLAHELRKCRVSIFILPITVQDIVHLLESRQIDMAVGNMPWSRWMHPQLEIKSVCEEKMVCIAAKNHPAIKDRLDLETFLHLPHARRSSSGGSGMVDEALARINKKRWSIIASDMYYALGLAVANTDIISVIPESVARMMTPHLPLDMWEVPLDLEPNFIDMAWIKHRADEEGIKWLSQLIRDVCHSPVPEMDIVTSIKGIGRKE